jgi:hypothetical protein
MRATNREKWVQGGGAYCEQYAVSGMPPEAVPNCMMPDATGMLVNTTCYKVSTSFSSILFNDSLPLHVSVSKFSPSLPALLRF